MRFRVDILVRAEADGSPDVGSAEFTDTTENYTLFDHVRIEHPLLLEVMRNGVLGEQRRLQANLGADPFAFRMRLVSGVLAGDARSELRTE